MDNNQKSEPENNLDFICDLYSSNHSKKNLLERLIHYQKNDDFSVLIKNLKDLSNISKMKDTLPSDNDEKLKIQVLSITKRIESELSIIENIISDKIMAITDKLVSNPNNLVEVLRDVSYSINLKNKEKMINDLNRAIDNVNRSYNPCMYTESDIEASKEEAYQRGYQAALRAVENTSIQTRTLAIDVT